MFISRYDIDKSNTLLYNQYMVRGVKKEIGLITGSKVTIYLDMRILKYIEKLQLTGKIKNRSDYINTLLLEEMKRNSKTLLTN